MGGFCNIPTDEILTKHETKSLRHGQETGTNIKLNKGIHLTLRFSNTTEIIGHAKIRKLPKANSGSDLRDLQFIK